MASSSGNRMFSLTLYMRDVSVTPLWHPPTQD
ncbi:hypothetical protein SGPA1_11519 [Streptomyces misionensis JCM 4497]